MFIFFLKSNFKITGFYLTSGKKQIINNPYSIHTIPEQSADVQETVDDGQPETPFLFFIHYNSTQQSHHAQRYDPYSQFCVNSGNVRFSKYFMRHIEAKGAGNPQ